MRVSSHMGRARIPLFSFVDATTSGRVACTRRLPTNGPQRAPSSACGRVGNRTTDRTATDRTGQRTGHTSGADARVACCSNGPQPIGPDNGPDTQPDRTGHNRTTTSGAELHAAACATVGNGRPICAARPLACDSVALAQPCGRMRRARRRTTEQPDRQPDRTTTKPDRNRTTRRPFCAPSSATVCALNSPKSDNNATISM